MTGAKDVVHFEISGIQYALDIHAAREIIEMVKVTPLPGSPPFITGIISLRDEITHILSLNSLMGLYEEENTESKKKIIILAPEAVSGSNVGLIVDDVRSVLSVPEENIDTKDYSISDGTYISGIIKPEKKSRGKADLIILLDIAGIISDTLKRRDTPLSKPKIAQV